MAAAIAAWMIIPANQTVADPKPAADAINAFGAELYAQLATGDENLVFSTDYPHGDSKYPDSVSAFADLPGLSEDSKRKILWDNWVRLYGTDG